MTARLTLLCHGATRSMRVGGFPAPDELLDGGGLAKATALKGALGEFDCTLVSPAAAAQQTAAALGLDTQIDDRLRDIGYGPWQGLDFAQVDARYSASLATWITAPERGVPGGESLEDARLRIAGWLTERAASGQSVIAVTHPMIVRAALAAALDLPLASVMRFDIAPLSRTTLSHNRVWRLQTMGL